MTGRFTIIMILAAALAIVAFAVFHLTSCHSTDYSGCLLTVCAFILTTTVLTFITPVSPVVVTHTAHRGVSLPHRLERPPRV